MVPSANTQQIQHPACQRMTGVTVTPMKTRMKGWRTQITARTTMTRIAVKGGIEVRVRQGMGARAGAKEGLWDAEMGPGVVAYSHEPRHSSQVGVGVWGERL